MLRQASLGSQKGTLPITIVRLIIEPVSDISILIEDNFKKWFTPMSGHKVENPLFLGEALCRGLRGG
jgi:hypothetical protein